MPVFTTACPRNCYSTCGLLVEIEEAADGRRAIRRITAHPGNRATASGPCLKGLVHAERVNAADRLLYPQHRLRSGSFERISWPSALELLAERLAALKERYGPQSVLYYTGSGTKGLLNRVGLDFWRLFGGCTTIYGDLCWPAGLEATRLTLGDSRHNAPWDLVNARLIVLWGKNPAETNLHQMPFISEAVDNGARVIVIDPRRTESAEIADLLVQPKPGSDGALALGLAHLLVRRGLVRRSFVEQHVLGSDELCRMVEEYPPQRVAELTGVPEPMLERLAEEIGTIEPLTICCGYGMQRYANGGQTVRAIIALLALTGNIGRPGAGWVYANLQSHVFDSPREPLACYPPDRPDGVIRVSVSTALLGTHLPAQQDPPVRMIWVERGNPVSQNPDTGGVLQALRSLDFRVVVDQLMTDTAREADLVLPAKTMFEQSDVLTAYWHPYLQLRDKLLEPPGEVKPETEIYFLLARQLGLPPERIREVIPEPSDEAVEAYLERRLAPFPELSLERLRRGPVLAPGFQEIAWADLRFATPSGRIELLSHEAAERWGVDPLPRWVPPQESATTCPDYPLHLLTPNTKDRIHSQLNNLPSIRELSPRPFLEMSAADAAERGVAEGELVRVSNSRGSLHVVLRIDHSLRPGCVVIHNGWWAEDGAAVNLLSAARETDMGHGAAFHDNAVQVEQAP